jgi:CubicO group peptidase (beta-lactamase class C family)
MKSESISAFLQERIDANDLPSAVYLVGEEGEVRLLEALGNAVVDPQEIEAEVDTVYDLASLTKPLVTGLLAAILIERGEIDPTAAIGSVLPEFHVSANAEITINDLLMHTSGLPAWRPFYLLVDEPSEISAEIARTLATQDQKPVTYSDLNFLVLAEVIERVADEELSSFAASEIFEPLKLEQTCFKPLANILLTRIAASEKGNEYEKRTCIELGYLQEPPVGGTQNAFRDHQIWGEVHDGNAWFKHGIAGHAGLFSSAAEVFQIAQQFMPNTTRLLKPETTELFRTNFTRGLNEDRSVAFQLALTEGSTGGKRIPPQSFGHTGFTGTSLWIDPITERVFILLTNRTHNHPLPFVNINSVRRRFHDLACEELDKNS